ncbi:MAG: hypothetical protein ACKV19_29570 [Verrucomicrobiales bacterium]
MSLSARLALIFRTVSAAAGAAADTLAQAALIPTAPPPPPAPSTPAAPTPAPDAAPTNPVAQALENLRKDLAVIDSAPPRKTRKRRSGRVPLRHRPDGPGCDYVDDDGTQFLSQRGVAERLHISVAHVAALESQGRLVRHMVAGCKVGYRCDDIERIAAMVEASKAKQEDATSTATPPVDAASGNRA